MEPLADILDLNGHYHDRGDIRCLIVTLCPCH